jgi:hypothetical protein
MNMSYTRMFVSMLLLFFFSPFANMINGDDRVREKLAATLREFAKSNGLTEEQLARMLGEIAIGRKDLRKGGVGMIDENGTYIILDQERNALLVAGKKWQGQNSKKSELVLLGSDGVYGSLGFTDSAGLRIVIFSPTEARYVDLPANLGFKFDRFTEPRDPNQ